MLVMVVVLVGLTLASSSELHKGAGLSRDVFYEIGGAGLLMAGIVIGCLQRLWKLHILLTPTEIVVPTAPASRTMMAIPRSSIITCEIVPVARWSRALVVYHHRGQLRLGDFRLPSSAALDEIYETLLTGRERQSSETEPRERRATDSASSPGAVLELKYSDYINWPALIAVSIIGSILGFGALDPSRNAPAAVRWSMAAFVGLFVVVWSVISTARWKGRIVLTQSTLSAPVFPGGRRQLSVPVSSIRHLEVTNERRQKRRLVVRHSGGRLKIFGRSLASPEAFDQLHAALRNAVATAQAETT